MTIRSLTCLAVAALCSPLALAQADVEKLLLAALRTDSFNFLVTQEPAALALAGSSVLRDQDRLTLVLRSGLKKSFTNRPQCHSEDVVELAQCVSYRLIAHMKSIHAFVVVKMLSDGGDYLVIDDQSGAETGLGNVPLFSRSGKRLIVAPTYVDEDGGTIQIWSRVGDRYMRAWSGSPFLPDSAPAYVEYDPIQWDSEDKVQVRVNVRDFPKPERVVFFSLRRDSGNWRVVETAAK